jgi:hypothetical protein
VNIDGIKAVRRHRANLCIANMPFQSMFEDPTYWDRRFEEALKGPLSAWKRAPLPQLKGVS